MQTKHENAGRIKLLWIIGPHGLALSVAVVMIYPLLWMTAASFRPDVAINNFSLWIGDQFTTENYAIAWRGVGGTTFASFFMNSLVVSAGSVIGNVVSCSLVAYAFAQIEFPLKRTLFWVMLTTLMIPFHAILIPQYLMFREFGWLNTNYPLIVPKFLATDAFFIYLLLQFFRTIPRELVDAARMDGAGHLTIFMKIFLPLSIPALATAAVFSFIYSWNDFFAPLVYLTKTENYTLPLALRAISDATAAASFGATFAMAVLSLLPVLAIFLAFQRLLLNGIATTGLKG